MTIFIAHGIMEKLLADPTYVEKLDNAKTTHDVETVILDFCINQNIPLKELP